VCGIVAALTWLVVRGAADNELAMTFVRLMHFSAIVIGFASLLLLPLMLKVRREPPPLVLIVVGVVAAALPMLVALW
jgi:hypothetical protein